MLPLYTELKAQLEQLFRDVAQQAAQSRLGPFATMPRVRQHEGDRLEYMTIDGAQKAAEYQRIGVSREIRPSEIPAMTFDDAMQMVARQGSELGEQEIARFLETLNQSLEEVGNAIHADGQPFTVDLLLQVLERIQFPFDSDGNPLFPALHIGPDMQSSVERVLREADEDGNAQARLKAVIDKKREHWNAEQDRRKLVD